MLKQCKKCRKHKEEKEFWKQPDCKKGLRPNCKKCTKDNNLSAQINICGWCGKEFHPRKSYPKQRYCIGGTCYHDARLKGNVPKQCPTCGKMFKKESRRKLDGKNKNSQKGHGKYCSIPCSQLGRRKRVSFKCFVCGTPKEQTQYQFDSCETHYCSQTCKNADNGRKIKGKKRTPEQNAARTGLNSPAWKGGEEYKKNEGCKSKTMRKKYSQKSYNRLKKIPAYRVSNSISRQISCQIKGHKNQRHWETLVGYTWEELKPHLENQFLPGMSWDNYGKWHIDHIIPKSVFNFTKPEHPDFERCWALSNLQPLWAHDNRSKHAKIDKHFQPLLKLVAV